MRPSLRVGDSTVSRLVLFGGLYFAQGVPWGFVTVTMVLRLSRLGLGPAAVGSLVALAQLPWTFKPLAGPLVDRVSFGRWGRRRPLLLATLASMAASLLVLGELDPRGAPPLFAAMIVAHNAFAALQDVATDALALDLLPQAERGRANGVMSAAKYAGVLAGGPGLAWVASAASWHAACVAATALLLLPVLLVVGAVEPARPAVRPRLVRETVRSFALRVTALAAVFTLVSGATDQFLYPTVVPLLRRRLALPDTQVSLLVTMAAMTGVAGALMGGVLADAIGRRRTIAIGAGLLAAAHLAFAGAAPLWTHLPVVIAYLIASGLASGTLYAATLAFCMDLTNPRVAATQFQIYMALLNVRLSWASYVGGRLGETLPAPTMFALAAALELAPLALLPALDARRAAEAFRAAAPGSD
jgi:MFS transporter, PAT family, beta-lactamase induction signal transducer AmpG